MTHVSRFLASSASGTRIFKKLRENMPSARYASYIGVKYIKHAVIRSRREFFTLGRRTTCTVVGFPLGAVLVTNVAKKLDE